MTTEQRLLKALQDLVSQLQHQLSMPEQMIIDELGNAQELLEELS